MYFQLASELPDPLPHARNPDARCGFPLALVLQRAFLHALTLVLDFHCEVGRASVNVHAGPGATRVSMNIVQAFLQDSE